MRRAGLIVLCLAGILWASPGCKHFEGELEKASMSGSIPEDSILYRPYTGHYK
jgi:hypothetical protein